MSITGVCQVCESAEGRHSCEQCGALVCDTHFERVEGLCSQCARRHDHGEAGAR